jgi:hypothetical protein
LYIFAGEVDHFENDVPPKVRLFNQFENDASSRSRSLNQFEKNDVPPRFRSLNQFENDVPPRFRSAGIRNLETAVQNVDKLYRNDCQIKMK